MLQAGAGWLAGKLKESASHRVTYVRGAERLELFATFGRTDYQVSNDYGERLVFTDRDFIIRSIDLMLGGLHAEPHSGDRIEEQVGGEIEVYEVMVPEGTEQCFRYSDPSRSLMRIHTKLVKVQ